MSKQDLLAAYEKFNEPHTFTPGQVVEWKPGMKYKKATGPFVVVEVLAEPVRDTKNGSGSPYWNEPLDVVLGGIDSDGDFVCHHYDSRRFQPAD